jgi:hypothetical protein
MRCTPVRYMLMEAYAREIHAYEVYARGMHVCEVQINHTKDEFWR